MNYLIFSDKFGEIYIKNLENNISEIPKILYGHSDPIHIMKISPDNKIIASADTFGKIKICEFPNIFNFLSAILFRNEDIKNFDFLSNKEIFVLDSDSFLYVWSLQDFSLTFKTDLKKLTSEDEILLVYPIETNKIFVENKSKFYIFIKEDNIFKKIYELSKNSKYENLNNSKFFFYKQKECFLEIDSEGTILKNLK